MNLHDMKSQQLFEAAMKSSGVSASDTRMVQEIAIHAASEALKRMMAVCDTAPDNLQGYALVASIGQLQAECSRQINGLLEHLKVHL